MFSVGICNVICLYRFTSSNKVWLHVSGIIEGVELPPLEKLRSVYCSLFKQRLSMCGEVERMGAKKKGIPVRAMSRRISQNIWPRYLELKFPCCSPGGFLSFISPWNNTRQDCWGFWLQTPGVSAKGKTWELDKSCLLIICTMLFVRGEGTSPFLCWKVNIIFFKWKWINFVVCSDYMFSFICCASTIYSAVAGLCQHWGLSF